MIRAGQIEAKRIGRSWVINQREAGHRAALGRPLGRRMARALVDVISGYSFDDLDPQDRFVAASYLNRLRDAENPADLLYSWLKSRQIQVVNLFANPADLAEIARDERVVLSGISDERSGMSSARELEGYVALGNLDAFKTDNLLVASDSPNVRFHVVEGLPSRTVPLGLVLADLADWNRPRENGRIVDLLREVKWSR